MSVVDLVKRALAAFAFAVFSSGAAQADDVLNTGNPYDSMFGLTGFDVSSGQTTAIAFVPGQTYRLDAVSLWLMSNDFENAGASLTISLRTDSVGGSVPASPSGTTIESWSLISGAIGWNPLLETVNSSTRPVLNAGQTYWIVAESTAPVGLNPIWAGATNGTPYYSARINEASGPDWQMSYGGWSPAVVVSASPVPEPSMAVLGLIGFPLLIWAARRRVGRAV